MERPVNVDLNGHTNGQTDGHKNKSKVPSRRYTTEIEPSLSAFRDLTSQSTSKSTYPLAASIKSNVPIYNLSKIDFTDPATATSLQDEWHHILLSGPGVVVLKKMYTDHSVLDASNQAFANIIQRERAINGAKGDHFAAGGKNDRIWNSFGKHAAMDPESFVAYYSNPWLALICDAWLGPGYRITAQLNVVKPGGAAQVAHRDYHLGFQTAEACAAYPIPMQTASQLLTIQGAVAHTDMPVESGPTRLLPFSQMFPEGFMAYRRQEFTDFFLENFISLPLEKGDGLFFNPALFHAAGNNATSDFERSANLLQVSSAFGKPMESVDTLGVIEKTWDIISEKSKMGSDPHEGGLDRRARAFAAAVAEGYPFPTNLDRRPPAPNGMAPESEQEVLLRALEEAWDKQKLMAVLMQMREDASGKVAF